MLLPGVCRSFAVFLLLFPAATVFATEHSLPLTPAEEQLAHQTGFDRSILQIIKEETQSSLHRMRGYDAEGFQIMVRGIVASVPENRTERVLSSLRVRLAPYHAMAFIVDMNESIKSDKIGVLGGEDQYEILRVMHTNGESDDISHEDLLDRLKEWEKKYPFVIIGAENDWTEIEFKVLPSDLFEFAEEIYDFCPDVVDEDMGTVLELSKDLKASKRLYLWWE